MKIMLILLGLILGFIVIFYGVKKLSRIVKKPILLLPIVCGLGIVYVFSFYLPNTIHTVEAQKDLLQYEIKEILGTDDIIFIEEDKMKITVLANGKRHKVYTNGKGKKEEVIVITRDEIIIYQKDKIKNDLN
jgi:hypothetical protein